MGALSCRNSERCVAVISKALGNTAPHATDKNTWGTIQHFDISQFVSLTSGFIIFCSLSKHQ
jgi:hypothetical protein